HYHAVADQALDILAQDAGRDQVQHGLLAIDHQGVTGVVAALVTHDGGSLVGQQIDDLALTLITPLGAQDYDILTHNTCPLRRSSMPAAAGGKHTNSLVAGSLAPAMKPLPRKAPPLASARHARAAGDRNRLPPRLQLPAPAGPAPHAALRHAGA